MKIAEGLKEEERKISSNEQLIRVIERKIEDSREAKLEMLKADNFLELMSFMNS